MTDILLWVVLPYLTIAVFVTGTAWRYRYDKFGWTTRSSQLHESRLLRIGNPLFHLGFLFVLGGHVVGLLVPERVTEWLAVTADQYHLVSLVVGALTGAATLLGLAVLLHRRWRIPEVRRATTRNDVLTYLVLGGTLLLGMAATVFTNGVGGGYDYRATVSPWFRGIFLLHPDPALMAHVPVTYRLHTLAGQVLFVLWPFSRLVHAFSAPIGYLFRPYIVYRSRGSNQLSMGRPRRGWDNH